MAREFLFQVEIAARLDAVPNPPVLPLPFLAFFLELFLDAIITLPSYEIHRDLATVSLQNHEELQDGAKGCGL